MQGFQRSATWGRSARATPHTGVSPALAFILAAMLALAIPARLAAQRTANEGRYVDRDNKAQSWAIQPGHTLLWNDAPYAPAGIVFRPEHLRAGGEESLAADRRTLDGLRTAGIQDVWVEPGPHLLTVPPTRLQAVIDELETRGFRYGLRIGDRSSEPLIGFTPTLRPINVRAEQLRPGAMPAWPVEVGGRKVAFVLAAVGPDDRTHLYDLAVGEAPVQGTHAEIRIPINPNSRLAGRTPAVLLAVPEVQIEPEHLGSFGDIWEGMEAYLRKLTAYLGEVKLGPGLRFLLDPFHAGDGTTGREDGVVPSSRVFQTAFQDWLSRQGGVSALNVRWRSTDRQIPTVEQAARLVPTWAKNDPPDGDGWLLDPLERVAYRCIPRRCRFWGDLEDFRAEWLRRWMNVTASTLRQDRANVPILYSWATYHPVFTNSPSPAGYDGLAAALRGDLQRLGTEQAPYALAQVEEADRASWLIASRLAPARAAPVAQPPATTTAADLDAAWTSLRAAGFRGVYLDPTEIADAPAQARRLGALMAADSTLAAERPRVCYFPLALATTGKVTRFANGVWWLPSTQAARLLRYGDSVVGYQIGRPFGDEHPVRDATVLWSTTGRQKVTFYHDGLTEVTFFDTTGKPGKSRPRKGKVELNLAEEPVIAIGLDATALFPLELAIATLKEFEALLAAAEAQRYDTTAMRFLYKEARESLAPNSAGAVYNSLLPYLVSLREAISPYVWMEGERFVQHSFDGVAFQAGCSAGNYLRLDRDPGVDGSIRARYAMDVRKEGAYDVWLAGRRPGGDVSSLSWQVDAEPATVVQDAPAVGGEYAPGMSWFRLGRVTLKPGRHELTVAIQKPGAGGRYVAGIDVLLLARGEFEPRGVERPYGAGQVKPRR